MLKLTTNNLYEYFSVATKSDSATLVGKRLYDFVDRQSRHLIVTIGDSWTWGADLSTEPVRGCHLDRLSDDWYRINNVYGNVLAQLQNADFLNLGESGSGNWYLYRKLKELQAVHHRLDYDRVTVIGVFTEVGRDFNSANDVDVDYRSWLLTHICTSRDYQNWLKFINLQITQRIHRVISNFDSRYQFVFATNFVDPIGHDPLIPWFVDKTWLQVIHCDSNCSAPCHVVFPWVIEKFAAVKELAPELDQIELLKWMNQITDAAQTRAEMCAHDNVNFGPLLHPLAANHARWAEYLNKVLYESV
jgi:hypothetical protein